MIQNIYNQQGVLLRSEPVLPEGIVELENGGFVINIDLVPNYEYWLRVLRPKWATDEVADWLKAQYPDKRLTAADLLSAIGKAGITTQTKVATHDNTIPNT